MSETRATGFRGETTRNRNRRRLGFRCRATRRLGTHEHTSRTRRRHCRRRASSVNAQNSDKNRLFRRPSSDRVPRALDHQKTAPLSVIYLCFFFYLWRHTCIFIILHNNIYCVGSERKKPVLTRFFFNRFSRECSGRFEEWSPGDIGIIVYSAVPLKCNTK